MPNALNWLMILLLALSSCTYTMKIQDGAMAVDRRQYAVAVPMLQKEFRKAKSRLDKGEKAFLLATAYRNLNQPEEALEWYRIAYDNGYGVDALRDYAYMLKEAERYEEAIVAFRDLGLEIGSPYEYRRELSGAEVAIEWLAGQPSEYEISLTGFNSPAADYAPTPYRDNQLIITSDRNDATGDDTYNWTGNAFSDFFIVDLASENVSGFSPVLNSPDNEGTLAFLSDYSEVIFTRCSGNKREDAWCRLYRSRVNADGSWSQPELLPFVKAGINYMHPAVSNDNRVLYFSSNDPDGWGGYDIYASERTAEGNWGEPRLLSRSVNTIYDEQFPHLDADTLYFSSDGHIGMGGLDIFRSYLLNGNWTPPLNLKPPVNSGGDDFGFAVDNRADLPEGILQQGYFSSRRSSGKGGDDVYRFSRGVPPPPPPAEEVVEYTNILDIYVLEKIYADPTDPNSKVLGRRPLEGASLTILLGNRSREVEVEGGEPVSLTLNENAEYSFRADAGGYLSNEAEFSSRGIGLDPSRPVQRFELEIVLDRIFPDREIVLENIYYDFDESFIREDARPTLNELAGLLTLNPDIRIQLGSHTDCRGVDRYNEELSQRRAQAAVDYLIQQGIDPGRLEARGYGESAPAVDCICQRCTEEEHQENRRTTFKIISS